MKYLSTLTFVLLAGIAFSQTAPVQDTTQAVDIQKVQIGETLGAEVSALLNAQQEADKRLQHIFKVLREQAALDTTYVLRGLTPKGEAIFMAPKKEQP